MPKYNVVIELSAGCDVIVSGQSNDDGAIGTAKDWLIDCEKSIEKILRNRASSYGITFSGDFPISFGLDESAQVYDVEDDGEDEDDDDE
jgi:hypothetical protein